MRRVVGWTLFMIAVTACDRLMPNRTDDTLPSAEAVDSLYAEHGLAQADVNMSGNVVELRVSQPSAQLERGGSLWARVGPYVYLFTPGTQALFTRYDGIAAVRVITTSNGDTVAQALLARDRLNEITWRRALNVLGRALQDGTNRPALLEELVQYGEANTDYEYNTRYVPAN